MFAFEATLSIADLDETKELISKACDQAQADAIDSVLELLDSEQFDSNEAPTVRKIQRAIEGLKNDNGI